MNLKKSLSLRIVMLAGALCSGLAGAQTPALTQWVVTSAKVNGAGGEQFVTSLRIFNPGSGTASVKLTLLAASSLDSSFKALGDNSAAMPVTVTVPAGQTLSIDDVIGTKFGSAAPSGGIRVVSDRPVSVTSQTLVANARSASGVPGTYGFSIPAQSTGQAIFANETGYLPYVSSAPSGATTGYRTNVFFLSLRNDVVSPNTVFHVKLLKGDGSTVGERDYTLGRLSQTQQNQIASSFGYTASDTNLTLSVKVTSGGPLVIGASVIDNAISSIAYTPPSKPLAQSGAYGMILDDSGYGFAGRLDVSTTGSPAVTLPDFMTAEVVLDKCPGGAQLYFFQAFTTGTSRNTTFTANADGSYSMTGNGAGSADSWTGTIFNDSDGSLFGSITYSRSAGATGCPGISKTFPFSASKSASF